MKTMCANAWTTVIGILGGMFYYIIQSGVTIPRTKADLGNLLTGAFLAALGIASKDATTGSRPPGA